MLKKIALVALSIAAGAAAQETPPAAGTPAANETKSMSGMSILGNQEAPKSLVIVPWKGSEIGDARSLATLLDDSRQPVDRDVFLRELGYYQIRSASP